MKFTKCKSGIRPLGLSKKAIRKAYAQNRKAKPKGSDA